MLEKYIQNIKLGNNMNSSKCDEYSNCWIIITHINYNNVIHIAQSFVSFY